jgi:hypothetical protein
MPANKREMAVRVLFIVYMILKSSFTGQTGKNIERYLTKVSVEGTRIKETRYKKGTLESCALSLADL